tara:strand:+ start:92 stop:460 length:369 start_codon:yes stop_codon:yes gene_type:complete
LDCSPVLYKNVQLAPRAFPSAKENVVLRAVIFDQPFLEKKKSKDTDLNPELHMYIQYNIQLALQGARLRFSRAYLAFQDPSCQAGMTVGTSSIGFDPPDSAQYAAEAAPIVLGGLPSGQDRY